MKLDDATSAGSLGFGQTPGSDSEIRVLANGSNFVFRANGIDSSSPISTDTNTHLFVFKLAFGTTDSVTCWMDPSDLVRETNSAAITNWSVTSPSSVDFSYLTLMRGAGATVSHGVLFDEIRFATHWGSGLFTSTNTVVPLPNMPTHLTWTTSGSNLTLSWPSNYTGWILQTQSNLLNVGLFTHWVDVPGSVSNSQWSVPINNSGAAFFRLRLP